MRLDNVWGVGGGVRPVKYLVKRIVLLLQEYLTSKDINEATLCLKELEVPHFHHELVYEVSPKSRQRSVSHFMNLFSIFLIRRLS